MYIVAYPTTFRTCKFVRYVLGLQPSSLLVYTAMLLPSCANRDAVCHHKKPQREPFSARNGALESGDIQTTEIM
jgi:hypothetical protein